MAAKDPGGNKTKSDRRWHAVSVKPGPGACEAATSGTTRRWLSREAPQLPLPGCDRPSQCHCTYQHHEDRRAGGRRTEELDAFARPVRVTTERRTRRDRRQPKD
ncbi:MAG TPA: hypothetical protein VFR29_01245 [Steroidobacteraceae bacterium]|nr:hypothetical protein [Steroidobacteraceae bacterium]